MKGENREKDSTKINPIIDEKFSHKISEIVPSVIYIFDLATLKNVYINREVGFSLGYSPEEVKELGDRFVLEKMHPQDLPAFMQYIEKLKKIKKDEVLTHEYRLKSVKSIWRWFQSKDTAYEFTSDGVPSRIIGTAIDITERKEMEQKLKEKQEQLDEAQSIAKLGYFSYNLVSGKGYGSNMLSYITGIDENKNLDNTLWVQTIHPDFRDKFRFLYKEAVAQKLPSFEMQYKIINQKTGEEKWVHSLTKNIYNDKEEVVEIFGVVQDVTQQMEVIEKLSLSNEKLDNIISHSSSMFYSHTPEGILTYVSPQSREILDCEPEMAMIQWQNFLTDNPINKLGVNHTTKAIKTGKKQPLYTLELKTKKGRDIWVQVDESPVVKDGKTIAIVGSLTDITERKRLEEKIKESEEKLRLVIESSPVGIVLYTPEGKALSANKRFNDLFGYQNGEIPDVEHWFLKAYPDKTYREYVLEKWEQHVNEYFKGKPFFSFEANVTCKDGNIKNIEFGFGAIEGLFITTFVDVTERNTILKEVERNQELLSENEKLSKTGAWEFDIASKNTFWTNGINRIFEIDINNIKDNLVESLNCYGEEDRRTILEAIRSSVHNGKEYDLVFPFTTFQNNQKWIRTILRPVIKNGEITRVISSLMDITGQVDNEMQLKELNATKDKLFSIVSHDLKNPMGAIINLAEVALERIGSIQIEELKRYLDVINKSGRRSIDLLNNLLEWSAINSGRISVYPRLIKLNPCVEGVGELLKTQIHNKNISFSHTVDREFTILADEKLLNTVLRNLISNSIKFTPEKGTIKLSAIKTESDYIISVSDTGIGISNEELGKLFDSKTFFSKNGTNNEKGSGLGLLLCNEFVKMHKGHIRVESELGKGTTFEVILPLTE